MARLLPLLIFLIVAIVLALQRPQSRSGSRDPRAYRPRRRFRDWLGGVGQRDEPAILRRAELEGIRDAYSGESIDPARPLVRCTTCRVLYHAESARVLARENQGRCAACGGSSYQAVTLLAD
jgi:hypothetical protein